MEIDAMLCDHAQVSGNKLFISGANINVFHVQPGPPHVINVHVAGVIEVPYTATNSPHKVVVRLIDEDGHPVRPWVPEGQDDPKPVQTEATINVGRPPHLPHGATQVVPIAIGYVNLPLRSLGRYNFHIEIDETEVRRLAANVMLRQGG